MRDAYKQTDVRYEYSEDMCPKTKDILARTQYIGTSIDRSKDDLIDVIGKIKNVASATPVGAAA